MAQAWRSLGGFFAVPIISGSAALVAIPLLIEAGGLEGWAAVAIAQGIGATAASFVLFGYGTVGPTEVARTPVTAQGDLYWASGVIRASLALVALPVAAIITASLVSPDHLWPALSVCAGVTCQGLSPAWFLTGQNRPLTIALMDTVPRAAALVVSVILVGFTGDLLSYGLALMVGEIGIAANAFVRLGQRPSRSPALLAQLKATIRQQWPLALAALVNAVYTRAAVPIVAFVAPGSVPLFAGLDRIQQFSRTSVRPLTMFFQGWVVRNGTASEHGRAVKASLATAGEGLTIGTGIALLLPTWGHLVFTEAIKISPVQAVLLGIAVSAMAGSMATSLYFIVPRGAIRLLTWTSAGGSLVGVPLLAVLSTLWGGTGAIAAVAITEVAMLVAQSAYISTSAPGS